MTSTYDSEIRCERCTGRGYKPERRPFNRPGFYARTCPRCGGTGSVPSGTVFRPRKRQATRV